MKNEQIFIEKKTLSEIDMKIKNINKNFCDYKGWKVNVKLAEDSYIITAVNNKDFIEPNGREYIKKLYIYPTCSNFGCNLKMKYKYSIKDFIVIKLLPFVVYFPFILISYKSIVVLSKNETVNSNYWLFYLLTLIITLNVFITWTYKYIKLDYIRYNLIKEILNKSFVGNFTHR